MSSHNLFDTGILLYHRISNQKMPGMITARDFERQLIFLKKYFQFIGIDSAEKDISQKALMLTFDDGFYNNFSIVSSILTKHNIPAIFFINDRHAVRGKPLWFSYLGGLEHYYGEKELSWRGDCYDMRNPLQRKDSVQNIRRKLLSLEPHPSMLYRAIEEDLPQLADFIPEPVLNEYFMGLSAAHIQNLSSNPLFLIGIHTTDHPYLTKCDKNEIRAQIQSNNDFINEATGRRPEIIAYPGGYYDERTIQICKSLKLHYGFAVQPMSKAWNDFEIPRVGIYSPSLLKLFIKAFFAVSIRRFQVRIG